MASATRPPGLAPEDYARRVSKRDLDHDGKRHGFCPTQSHAQARPETVLTALCGLSGLRAQFGTTGEDCPACRQLTDLYLRGIKPCPTCGRWSCR